jgi:phage-related protein
VNGIVIRDIAISFGYAVDKASEKKANDSVNALKSTATKVLGAISVVFSIKGLASLAEAATDAEALKSQFTQVFGDMEKQAGDSLNGIADETGVAVGRMRGSFAQIAAFAKTTGMDSKNALGLTDRAMRAVADSAAFYDKSLEQVTDSLQSFLKGNYANDAALGLSATETTRNAAANALYGTSFKNLAEDQKQLTLLKMVEDANVLSGALGQAARESDTWTNQLGNLKQSLTELKAAFGGTFLKPAVQALKLAASFVANLTKSIQNLSGDGAFLNRVFQRMSNRITRLRAFVDRLVKRLGGAEKLLKLLAVAAGALFAAMNAGKILSFMKSLTGALSLANLKILGIAAVIALILLAVDDFINFMQGNDSVIGLIFESWGIDADGVRDKVIGAWNAIKTNLQTAWKALKETAGKVFLAVKNWVLGLFDRLKENGAIDNFKEAFSKAGEAIEKAFKAIQAVFRIFSGTAGDSADAVQPFIAWLIGVALPGVLGLLSDVVGAVADAVIWLDKVGALKPLIIGVVAAFAAFKAVTIATNIAMTAMAAAQRVVTAAQWLMNAALSANPIGLIIAGVAALIAIFAVLWNNSEEFRNFFIGMWEGIKSAVSAVVDWFKGAVESVKTAFGSVRDFFKNAINKIVEFFQPFLDVIGKVSDFINGGLKKAGDFIGGLFGGGKDDSGSVPGFAGGTDKTPDTFIAGEEGPELVAGARGRKVFSAAQTGDVFRTMKDIASLATTPRPETVASSAASIENKSVIQNVEITNQFNGDRAGQKKSAEAMGKAAGDATGILARGLAYAR